MNTFLRALQSLGDFNEPHQIEDGVYRHTFTAPTHELNLLNGSVIEFSIDNHTVFQSVSGFMPIVSADMFFSYPFRRPKLKRGHKSGRKHPYRTRRDRVRYQPR